MKRGSLVKVFAPSLASESDGELGLGIFIRRLIPSQDLSKDHPYWKNKKSTHAMSNFWHNEIIYCGTIHILLEKQFPLKEIQAE